MCHLFSDLKTQHTFREPRASITVTDPHYIGFTVNPGKVWVLEVGREYEFMVDLYDKLGHKMLITDVKLIAVPLLSLVY